MNDSAKKNMAFTLAETLAALVISVMIIVAVLGIYGSIKRSAASINKKIERDTLPAEILQRIAEDIDRMIITVTDTKIIFNNKLAEGNYSSGQLIIESAIYDTDKKPQTFEKIVWQSKNDPDANGLILYRAHSGYAMEDRILDETKEKFERELFIPICSGLTHFSIAAIQGETLADKWDKEELPVALEITLSFAEPVEILSGQFEVPEEDKIRRTIAIDRTRQIPYMFVEQEFILPTDESESNDVNSEPNSIKKESDEIRNVSKE